ncbi:hypothetical protein BJ138DRAFT_975499, partial [Hygrophoropsis aurantiaca]
MHNLLLGLVMFHFRNVLELDHSSDGRPTTENRPPTAQEMQIARKVMGSCPDAKKLGRCTVPALTALCVENTIHVAASSLSKGICKSDLITALLVHTDDSPPLTTIPGNASDGGAHCTDILGDDFIQECVTGQDIAEEHTSHFSKGELAELRASLATVVRPTWHCGPPLNLGEPGHGKLKADQWRSCIEFDFPVALVQLWTRPNTADEVQINRQQELIKVTMFLAMAIRWGTSHRTSPHHAQRYTDYMHAYLVNLRNLSLGIEFRPNHHFALHIGEFFLRFGPMHGWWMFPFERIIGILQQVNTNHKLAGQLEVTMLETFCAAANVKGFLQQQGCPSIIKESAAILDQCWGQYNAGTLMTDMRTL